MLKHLRALCAVATLLLACVTLLAPQRANAQAAQIPNAKTCFQATTGVSGMVGSLGTITGGSGGANGVYPGVALTGGTGTGATANITVSGAAVTGVAIVNPGAGYAVGDTLSAVSGTIGNVSGFSVPVASVSINSSLAGGQVAMYLPGTLTPASTYQDSGQTILNPNPIPLDLNGCATIYGIGTYRQVVYDSLGNTVWDQLTTAPVPSASGSSVTNLVHVANITALQALASTAASAVVRDAYNNPGDAPPLEFYSSNSACSLNSGQGDGGSQFPSFDGKCWIANFATVGYDPREWGAIPDGATDSNSVAHPYLKNFLTFLSNLPSLPAATSGTSYDVSFGGRAFATSQPLSIPKSVNIHDGTLVALANSGGTPWCPATDITVSVPNPSGGTATIGKSSCGVVTISSSVYAITLRNIYIDVNRIPNVTGLYCASKGNIEFDNVNVRHWVSGGAGEVLYGCSAVHINDNIQQWNAGDYELYQLLSNRVGCALCSFQSYDNIYSGGNFSNTLVPMYVDTGSSTNVFKGVHPYQSSGGVAQFTATISGTSMVVTGVFSGTLAVGQTIVGPGLANYGTISVSPGGGTGTYTLTVGGTVSSPTTLYADAAYANPNGVIYDGYANVFSDTYLDSNPVLIRISASSGAWGYRPNITMTNTRALYNGGNSTFNNWIQFTSTLTPAGGDGGVNALWSAVVCGNWPTAGSGNPFSFTGTWYGGATNVDQGLITYLTGLSGDSCISGIGSTSSQVYGNVNLLGGGTLTGNLDLQVPTNASTDTISHDNAGQTRVYNFVGTTNIHVSATDTQGGTIRIYCSSGPCTLKADSGGAGLINQSTGSVNLLQGKLYVLTFLANSLGVAFYGLAGSGI